MSETSPYDRLAQRLADRTAVVGVIGLGYVGLPLALVFAEQGFRVLGFDIDSDKVESLNASRCYISHLDATRLQRVVETGRFEASEDFARLGEADAVLICVPTPLSPQREPDLRFVRRTAESLAATLRPAQLIVLESTTYPGTTDELVGSTLEASGLRCGQDFFLAYSPEREDPGNPKFGTRDIPKVVGGVDAASGELADQLYRHAVGTTVRVSSARVAEATKLLENIFRAVNIALVNELKVVYDRMGIDVWEVLAAAETKPFGFMRFDPGPGWGGHCIPLDPFYLAWKAREYGVSSRFIELAGEVNLEMHRHVVHKVVESLNRQGKPVRGSRILVLGLAYKPDIADPRESPAFPLIDRLLELGAEVEYHDPHIPVAPAMRSWPDLPPLRSVELTDERLAETDLALLVTHHRGVDYERVAERVELVVDTRGVFPAGRAGVVPA